ncbi:MAG: isopentenyl phosphate kinase [Chloroflexota bacterium]
MTQLIFLKLGGSLITDKTQPYTPRLDVLDDLARQIRAVLQTNPGISLVLGHGSGSFGHTAARKYNTRDGLQAGQARQPEQSNAYWHGFSEVWLQASALNRHVMEALHRAGVASLALAPVAAVTAHDGKVSNWDLRPLRAALAAGILPVVYGDVIFDSVRAGTILSTEDLFENLAEQLHPQRILLAGLEGAVWADFPERKQRVEKITPASFDEVKARVGQSHAADVTGGMESKVRQMLTLVQSQPGLTVQIFSGEAAGNIQKALAGQNMGTILAAS